MRYSRLSTRPTRFGSTYGSPSTCSGQFSRDCYASVVQHPTEDTVTLHSTAPVFIPRSIHRTFLQRLRALPNQSLWHTLCIDGDGTWIYDALMRGTLICMSDGSYNDRISREACSLAAILCCKSTGCRATVTWVERSNSHSATNFRGEILGSIAIQLLLQVATDGKYTGSTCRRLALVVIIRVWFTMGTTPSVLFPLIRSRRICCGISRG